MYYQLENGDLLNNQIVIPKFLQTKVPDELNISHTVQTNDSNFMSIARWLINDTKNTALECIDCANCARKPRKAPIKNWPKAILPFE